MLAHCSPSCVLARASPGICLMGGSSGHLGQHHKCPGPGQAAQHNHSVPPQLSMPALSLYILYSSALSYPQGSKTQFCPHHHPATTCAGSSPVSPVLRDVYLALPPMCVVPVSTSSARPSRVCCTLPLFPRPPALVQSPSPEHPPQWERLQTQCCWQPCCS